MLFLGNFLFIKIISFVFYIKILKFSFLIYLFITIYLYAVQNKKNKYFDNLTFTKLGLMCIIRKIDYNRTKKLKDAL